MHRAHVLLAGSAMAALLGLISLFAQTPPAAPKTQGPQWKDGQAEYNLYDAANKAADPRKKLAALDAWKEKYPNSDFKMLRMQLYLNTYQQLGDVKKLVATLDDMLAQDPKNVQIMNAIMFYTPNLGDNSPAVLDHADQVANAALANLDNKPANVSDADWQKGRKDLEALSHKTLGWTAMQRKNADAAEQEFTKVLQMNPNAAEVDYWLGLVLRTEKTPEKQSQALFYFARAAVYDGPGALNEAGRKDLDAYLAKAYNSYHGQDDPGLGALKQLARSQPLPPPDFKIKTQYEVASEKEEEFKKSNPQLALWLSVKKELTSPNGQQYFDSNMKGAAVPPLKGTVIEAKPAVRSKELVVGIADPKVPEVILKLDTALAGKPKVGGEIEFEGIPSAFTPDPFTVTFDVERAKIKGLEVEAARPPLKKTPPRKKAA